ncbi:MAG TPA: hypothetical protein VEZ71_16500, partial [Archangium sp.]|nr:hypothetical protein [Archangium sp.]
YRSVSGMRIAPERVGEAQVFRPWGWEVVLLVSEDVKQALERVGATGQKFEEVTGPSPISSEERARRRWTRERHEQAMAAREGVWRSQGNLDDEVTLLVVGGNWPSGSAVWKVIHRPQGRTLLVTDGLSDPFSEENGLSVGFGLELALETDAVMKKVRTSWPFKLMERVSNEVAAHEHVRERMKASLFSMEVSGKGLPRSLLTGEGRVGVLLGMEARTLPAHFTLPAGEVTLVTVKALLPAELDYLLARGAEGQVELARRFTANGEDHVSRVRRRPVV